MATVAEVIAARWQRSAKRAEAIHLSETCDTYRTQNLGQDDALAPAGDPKKVHSALPCAVVVLGEHKEVQVAGRVMGLASVCVYVANGTPDLLAVDEIRMTTPAAEGSQQARTFDVVGVCEEDSRSNLVEVYCVRRR